MRTPRFTLRGLMIVVAIAALLLGIERTRRRWVDLKRRAETHAWNEKWYRGWSEGTPTDEHARKIQSAARVHRLYHAHLKAKYQRLSSRPWESVQPDPPQPDPIPLDLIPSHGPDAE